MAKEVETMGKRPIRYAGTVIAGLLMFLMPVAAPAEVEQARSGPPPIAQSLVREGDLAMSLVQALGLKAADDEAAAESSLGDAGIVPRNGWIADYPVTPDVLAELRTAVAEAAEAGKIPLGKEAAVQRLDSVADQAKLSVRPHDGGNPDQVVPEQAADYPNQTVINNYYTTEGPPVVTYYAPPPDYYYLYSWVPSPFWCIGFWFPGFFILNDFHRSVFLDHRVRFISNHFNDVRAHRVFRIDPVARFRGRTFAGIGVASRKGFISTGVPHSDRRIFNGPRSRTVSGGRSFTPAARGGARVQNPPARGQRAPSRVQGAPSRVQGTPARIQGSPSRSGPGGSSPRGTGREGRSERR